MREHAKQLGKTILLDHLGGLAIAFAACFIASWVLSIVGASGPATTSASLFVFFAFVFADPVGAWRGSQTWARFRIKVGTSVVLAIMLSTVFGVLDVQRIGLAATLSGMNLLLLLPLLLVPMIFMGPLVERILSGRGPNGDRLTWEDFQFGLTFPIYVTGQFTLIAAIALALWGSGVPWAAGLVFLTGGVLAAVSDTFQAPEDAQSGETPSAWAGLRRAFRTSFPSALFLGGASFTLISLAVTAGQSGAGTVASLAAIVNELSQIGTVVLAALLCLASYAVILTGTMAFIMARRADMDLFAVEDLVHQSLGRLFMGGLAIVRPEMEDGAQ